MAKFDDFGTRSGLAYKHDWAQATNNMLRFEQYKNQQQLQREKKAQYYADRIKKGNASTKYNSSRLEKYYNNLNSELGKFMVDNPNWESDVMLVNEFNDITDKYLNNEILKEDLDVQQNLELIRQDRHNMSDDHFYSQMEQYDKYDAQEVGDDPLAESQTKFRYIPEAKLDFVAVASDVGKNNVRTITTKQTIGDEEVTRTKIDEKSLEMGVALIESDPVRSKSLDAAWKSYKGNDYATKRDFAIASLRSTIDIQELRRKLRPSEIGGGLGDSGAFNPYTKNIVDEIYENGSATLTKEAIAFSDYGNKGALMNPRDAGVTFVGGAPLEKYEFIDNLTGMRLVNAYEMRYVPENKAWVMDVSVVFDKPNNNDIIKDLTEKGFTETENYFSYFGDIGELQQSPKRKGMHGKITIPADPTDTNRYLLYEQEMGGKGLKQQTLVQQYAPLIESSFNRLSDIMDERISGIKSEEELKSGQNISTPGSQQEYVRPTGTDFWNEEQTNVALNKL
jgi:hypothetical protein